MPRTVTYYNTTEVIAMLEADHEREFEAPDTAFLFATRAYFGACSMRSFMSYGGFRYSDAPLIQSMERDDWQLTKGKP